MVPGGLRLWTRGAGSDAAALSSRAGLGQLKWGRPQSLRCGR